MMTKAPKVEMEGASWNLIVPFVQDLPFPARIALITCHLLLCETLMAGEALAVWALKVPELEKESSQVWERISRSAFLALPGEP